MQKCVGAAQGAAVVVSERNSQLADSVHRHDPGQRGTGASKLLSRVEAQPLPQPGQGRDEGATRSRGGSVGCVGGGGGGVDRVPEHRQERVSHVVVAKARDPQPF